MAKNELDIEDGYLGDGVYVSYDGIQVWLDLRGQDSTTRIALNQNVLKALNTYVQKIGVAIAEHDYTVQANEGT